MPITGILGGANEQRAIDVNYLAALDQMRRAAAAQEMERQRMEQQAAQFGQQLTSTQAQQAAQNEMERQRIAAQQSQFGQSFGLQQAQEQRQAELARQQGAVSQFDLSQKQQGVGARNALADMLTKNPDMGTRDLGLAFLQSGGEPTTAINFLKAAQEEQSAQRREQQAAQKDARAEWQIFEKEGIRVNRATGAVEPLIAPSGVKFGKSGAATEDERKAAGWLAQATNAYNNMASAAEKSPDVIAPGMLEAAASATGLEGTANLLRSPERQQFVQAAKSFSEAALRAATGAGVTKDEAKQKIEELTPQWTDAKEVRQQKLDSLKIYLDSLQTRAGRAAGDVTQERGEIPQSTWQSHYKSKAAAVNDALEAIRKGAPRDVVRQRLIEGGIQDARI